MNKKLEYHIHYKFIWHISNWYKEQKKIDIILQALSGYQPQRKIHSVMEN